MKRGHAAKAWMGQRFEAVSRRSGRMKLSVAVVLAVFAGAAIAAIAEVVLILVFHPARAGGSPIDITKLAFTVVGGVGAVVGLVIAYRRQRDLEQGRFVERFGAAAAQLGASDVAVRIAGVYAMAGVADESEDVRRQQCIDVLCGYLRLPYHSSQGTNHQTKRTRKWSDPDREQGGDLEDTFEYRQNDREVRTTIVRVIADHLRTTAEYSWSTSNFDFRGAYLEEPDFSEVRFAGNARFNHATFASVAWFGRAAFAGNAWFNGATFVGEAGFGETTFGSDAEFSETTFNGNAWFSKAVFDRNAWFTGATFTLNAEFAETTFNGNAGFGGATFNGDSWFAHATFDRSAWFQKAHFVGGTDFSNTTFSREARFEETTFYDDAWYRGATFNGDAQFSKSTFNSEGRFHRATFNGDADFGRAVFTNEAEFAETTFNGHARFDETTFSGSGRFEGVAFSGQTAFERTDFGAGTVSFAHPRRWGPPMPVFDWGDEIIGKPDNIEPQDWPPTTTTSL
ncbi:pentapeptide repeat-containing protein [Nocardia nova]|uniref:pentapeptide repeat-containing protein n=1 Tax=Nocardia nova TaxID=37330 RepID=UPI000CEA1F68|nr:pentapeptide repeat-containing protein [Nocardia nova]PPJ01082.1 hypothetical protein C5E51_34895 [Nocardia nova]PPJ21288.1 hypothetical protein C5E44_06925 [Nocardia nova]